MIVPKVFKNLGLFIISQIILLIIHLISDMNIFNFMIFIMFIIIYYIISISIQSMFKNNIIFNTLITIMLAIYLLIFLFTFKQIFSTLLNISGYDTYLLLFFEYVLFSTLLYFNIGE